MFSREILWIFDIIFFTEHLRWLLLEGFCEGTSLVKILQFRVNHRYLRKMPIKKTNE